LNLLEANKAVNAELSEFSRVLCFMVNTDNLMSHYAVSHCKINTYGIYRLIYLHRFVRGTRKVAWLTRE